MNWRASQPGQANFAAVNVQAPPSASITIATMAPAVPSFEIGDPAGGGMFRWVVSIVATPISPIHMMLHPTRNTKIRLRLTAAGVDLEASRFAAAEMPVP